MTWRPLGQVEKPAMASPWKEQLAGFLRNQEGDVNHLSSSGPE